MKPARSIACFALATGLLFAWGPRAGADEASCRAAFSKAQEKYLLGLAKLKAKEVASLGTGKKPLAPDKIAEKKDKLKKKSQALISGGCAGIAAPVDVDPLLCVGMNFDECLDSYTVEAEVLVETLEDTLLPEGVPCVDCPRGPGGHKCVLDAASRLLIATQLSTLTFGLTGSIDIACGTPDSNTGKALCDCTLQNLAPVDIPGLGLVCFTPGEGCPSGEIDCDGGNDLQWSTVSEHNIGPCMSNADCNAQCDIYCAGLGMAQKADQNDNCEGFCDGGANADGPCIADSECPGGACNGGDGLPHGNVCGCQCLAMVGPPSAAGDFKCQLPTEINIEGAAPCDGADILIAMGSVCIPLSTQSSENVILTADNDPNGVIAPEILFGAPPSCATLATSVATGISMVGQVDFLDAAIGDMGWQVSLTCD